MPALIAPLVALAIACGAAAEPADLVLRSGKIVTLDPAQPVVAAIAVRGGRIAAIGSDEQIMRDIGPQTRVFNLAGKLAVPGFIEGHGHFTGLGQSRMVLDLTGAKSWDEIVAQVGRAAAAAPPGKWIRGRGWHQGKWRSPPEPNVEGYPLQHRLSQASPRNPVWLVHATGHMSFANALAMELAKVTRETRDPAGGEVLRDQDGNPTGAFRETAQGLFQAALATNVASSGKDREENLRQEVELANDECLRNGVTSFQDAGSSFATIDALRDHAEQGQLGVRLWVMVNEGNAPLEANLKRYRIQDAGDHHLTVRGIKRMMDGALGTHGAWLFEPYVDLPDSRGLATISLESLARTAQLAETHDFQLCVHAIGDRANHEVLDLFARVRDRNPRFPQLRWRIEHAQHLAASDISRFAELGVIASMQANHCTSDGPFVIERLGRERAEEGAYAWRKLLDAGALVINGTDAPVEDVNPIGSFYAAVTRRMRDGRQFFPGQCMSRVEALRSYTVACAYGAFEEDQKGSLSVGKLADIVVLSRDIMTVPEEEILGTEVLYTIVGGRVLYEKTAMPSGSDK
jgi:predicted amidohydrolase YtcJ